MVFWRLLISVLLLSKLFTWFTSFNSFAIPCTFSRCTLSSKDFCFIIFWLDCSLQLSIAINSADLDLYNFKDLLDFLFCTPLEYSVFICVFIFPLLKFFMNFDVCDFDDVVKVAWILFKISKQFIEFTSVVVTPHIFSKIFIPCSVRLYLYKLYYF